MNNIASSNFKRYSYFPSSVPKTESNEAKEKRSSFYDDYLERLTQNKQETGYSINRPVLKFPDLTSQEIQSVSQNSESTGSVIKKKIKNVLSKKYGELDTRNLFDDIDDKDIEDSIKTAENTIKLNIDRGNPNKYIFSNLPNLRDGLALFYAAANKGNSKAAKRAREAAYMESIEPPVKKSGTNMLSSELPKIHSIPKTTAENLVWKPGKKTNAEKLIYSGKNIDFANNTQKEEGVDYTSSNKFSSSFYDDYVDKRKENNNIFLPFNSKILNELKPMPKNENFSLTTSNGEKITPSNDVIKYFKDFFSNKYNVGEKTMELMFDSAHLETLHKYMSDEVKNAVRPNNIGKGVWEKQVANDLKWIDDMFGKSSKAAKTLKMLPAITIGIDTIRGIKENVENKSGNQEIVSDAIIDISFGTINAAISAGLGGLIGSVTAPGVGAVAGIVLGIFFGWASEDLGFKGTSLKEFADKTVDFAINGIKKWFD